MFFNTPTKPTTAQLLMVIEKAKDAELCRNLKASQEILRTVWEDPETDPNFDYCEPVIKAELLRLCGVFLSLYGMAKVQKNFQLRGKDLLTTAIDIFENHQLAEKAAEAKIMLAFCYWNEGEVSECESYLDTVEYDFRENQLHPVYLQCRINRLMTLYYKAEFTKALEIISEISIPMSYCKDNRLLAMFHNQAGIVFQAIGKSDKGIFHLNEAIRYAKKADNQLFVAINLNNLSYLYKGLSEFKQAHECINDALEGFKKINHLGFVPHCLDTKALIYLDDQEIEKALEMVETSLDLLKDSDDNTGITNSMFTKVLCYLRLNRKYEATMLYGELHSFAAKQVGEVACRKFADKLADEIYIMKGLSLSEEVAEFKKSKVREALIKFGNNMTEVAAYLKIKNHQTLSDILNNQFPELYDELGIKRRRSPNKTDDEKTAPARQPDKAAAKQTPLRHISPVIMKNTSFAFDFHLRGETIIQTFYFDKKVMLHFGIKTDAIVAVVPVRKFENDLTVLVPVEQEYIVGKIEFDDFANMHFVLDEKHNPVLLEDVNVVGVPIAYCPFKNSDGDVIHFTRLKIFE